MDGAVVIVVLRAARVQAIFRQAYPEIWSANVTLCTWHALIQFSTQKNTENEMFGLFLCAHGVIGLLVFLSPVFKINQSICFYL